eukprot:scaffold33187_cov111-Isochrysis_galbana.AAC.1
MAPPSYASALTGDFLGVPSSPKRPREDEQPEVRRTAQSRAWPWPDKTTPRARGGVTMAPLQLRLEPTEVVLATDKGAARARVDSTEEISLQV